MTRLCLDTSAYSELVRGLPAVAEFLARATWIGIPSIVIGELASGFQRGNKPERNLAILREFLANPVVEIVPVDSDVAFVYGAIHADLRAAGRPIPTNDMWIAACSIARETPLVTFDSDFENVGRLQTIRLARP